jgi:hypothetical protein
LLSAQRAVEHLGHIVVHTQELGFGCDRIGLLLLLVDVAAKAELAAQHDGLRDKAALFSTTVGAAANLVALVADRGIGIESSLPGLGLRAADDGRGLLQGRIVSIGHGEKASSLSGVRAATPCSSCGAGGPRITVAATNDPSPWPCLGHSCIDGCCPFCAKSGAVTNHNTGASLFMVFSRKG